jgi:hypothetical protein
MGYAQETPTVIYGDNQGAIKYCHTKESYGKMKHIDIKYMYTREQVVKGVVTIRYVESQNNPADILTKTVGKAKFVQHKERFGLRDMGSS